MDVLGNISYDSVDHRKYKKHYKRSKFSKVLMQFVKHRHVNRLRKYTLMKASLVGIKNVY